MKRLRSSADAARIRKNDCLRDHSSATGAASGTPNSAFPHPRIPDSSSNAFTLVELLVVITIIGILIALLLPAVQAAREAARQVQCKNHLKQIALGCLNHEQVHGFFPSGGWGNRWNGDPDRGFGHKQTGGWVYSLLPYVEQEAVFSMGSGATASEKRTNYFPARLQIPLEVFVCPSRRSPELYPHVNLSTGYYDMDIPEMVFRGDYSANGGGEIDSKVWYMGPSSLADGDAMTMEEWASKNQGTATGVMHLHSETRQADITDGTSKTYLVGEEYLNPDYYYNGLTACDDQGSYEGEDWDNTRFAYWIEYLPPMQDTPGYNNCMGFGSPHPGGCHMAFCDGSVQTISYSINEVIHYNLCDRMDGAVIDGKSF